MSLQDILPIYQRGQLEVENHSAVYLHRGEIQTIGIEDRILRIRLEWNAHAIGYPPLPTGWALNTQLEYSLDLSTCVESVDEIRRAMIQSPSTRETITIYPREGSCAIIPKPTQ